MQFRNSEKINSNFKLLFITLLFLIYLLVALFFTSPVKAQNHELFHPYEGFSDQALEDINTLGRNNFYNLTPNIADFNLSIPETGDAGIVMAQERAHRRMEYFESLGQSYDYAILIGVTSTNSLTDDYLDTLPVYRYSLNDYENKNPPTLLGSYGDILPNNNDDYLEVLFFEYPALLSFYNSLPDIYAPYNESANTFKLKVAFSREPEASQTQLNEAMDSFKKTPLALDPFVRVGLKYVQDIILIKADTDNNNFSGSPSQYDSLLNIVYINKKDLDEYGDVVIFHELLQAGLINALKHGYITANEFKDIENIENKYFSSLGYSYINSTESVELIPELSVITAFKAFAIGYTYKVLNENLTKLNAESQVFSQRFFADVKYNRYLLTIDLDLGFAKTTVQFNLIGNPSIDASEVNNFITMFTSNSSLVNKDIKKITDKIKERQGKDDYIKILPALTLLLAD